MKTIKHDIVNYIHGCVMSGSYTIKNNELYLTCPNCGDNREHFSVNIQKSLYHCFKCNFGGNFINSISQHFNEWSQIRALISVHPVIVNEKRNDNILKGLTSLDSGKETFESHDYLIGFKKRVVDYCLNRGMIYSQITNYHLMIKSFENKIYFPYWQNGRVTYLTERNLSGIGPKVIDIPGMVKPLYGRHIRRLDEIVVLVEGVFDHFVTPYSYAMLGSSITDEQITTLKYDGISNVIIINDPDVLCSAIHNKEKLAQQKISAFVVVLPDQKDPADIGSKGMSKIVYDLMSGSIPNIDPFYVRMKE